MKNEEIAKALNDCDWSDAPIGNKAILVLAVEALSAMPDTSDKSNFNAWLETRYPNKDDRQHEYRATSAHDLMLAAWNAGQESIAHQTLAPNAADLSSCPFCASNDVFDESTPYAQWGTCANCGAKASNWNNRASLPAVGEVLEYEGHRYAELHVNVPVGTLLYVAALASPLLPQQGGEQTGPENMLSFIDQFGENLKSAGFDHTSVLKIAATLVDTKVPKDRADYCKTCGGQGAISTGIAEWSSTQCEKCDGTGFAAVLPQVGEATETERIQKHLLDPLVVHTNMCAGKIAKIGMRELAHVHGGYMVTRWNAFEQWERDRICKYCDDTGYIHDQAGEFRGACNCEVAKENAQSGSAPASLGEAKAVAPEGWKLVPTRATSEMEQAADDAFGNGAQFDGMYVAALAVAPIAQALPVAAEKYLPQITLTGQQLKDALDWCAPERDTDPDQLESEVTIGHGDERHHSGKGLYLWWTDYPEEGSIPLFDTPDDAATGLQGEKA